jgi:hypothetical protein
MRTLTFAVAAAIVCVPAFAQTPDGSFERTLTVSGGVDLDLNTDSGGIVVSPGAPGSVRVKAILKAHRGRWVGSDVESRIRAIEQNPPVDQTGNRIRVGYLADPKLLKGISMRLEIQTPPETSLRAHSDSGGVRVSGIKGPIECETDSGGIEARQIGSDVRVTADSGGIHVHAVQGSLYARADSGGIEATGIGGAIDVETDSGGIQLEQITAAPIRAQADSGGATVRLAPTGGYDLNASSDSGRITVPEMIVKGSFSRHHIEGKVRGGGPLVNVRVDSGNLVIE